MFVAADDDHEEADDIDDDDDGSGGDDDDDDVALLRHNTRETHTTKTPALDGNAKSKAMFSTRTPKALQRSLHNGTVLDILLCVERFRVLDLHCFLRSVFFFFFRNKRLVAVLFF